jgi:hypothetical protein
MPLRNLLATHMEWKEKLLSGNQVLQPARLLVVERMSTRRSSLSLDFWKSCREFLWLTGTQTDQNSVQISQIPEGDQPANAQMKANHTVGRTC